MGLAACILASHQCDGQIETLAYITNRDSNSVSVVDTGTNNVIATLTMGIGVAPIGVAVTPDGRFAYIANSGTSSISSNSISVIDVATNAVIGSVAVGNSPFGVSVTPDGKLAYVANSDLFSPSPSNTVSVINTVTNTVTGSPITVGISPLGVAITPNGHFAYVTNNNPNDNPGGNTVSVINTATNQVVANVPVGTNPEGVAIAPERPARVRREYRQRWDARRHSLR